MSRGWLRRAPTRPLTGWMLICFLLSILLPVPARRAGAQGGERLVLTTRRSYSDPRMADMYEPLTIEGSGFAPDSEVVLDLCDADGQSSSGFALVRTDEHSGWSTPEGLRVLADDQGTFTVTAAVGARTWLTDADLRRAELGTPGLFLCTRQGDSWVRSDQQISLALRLSFLAEGDLGGAHYYASALAFPAGALVVQPGQTLRVRAFVPGASQGPELTFEVVPPSGTPIPLGEPRQAAAGYLDAVLSIPADLTPSTAPALREGYRLRVSWLDRTREIPLQITAAAVSPPSAVASAVASAVGGQQLILQAAGLTPSQRVVSAFLSDSMDPAPEFYREIPELQGLHADPTGSLQAGWTVPGDLPDGPYVLWVYDEWDVWAVASVEVTGGAPPGGGGGGGGAPPGGEQPPPLQLQNPSAAADPAFAGARARWTVSFTPSAAREVAPGEMLEISLPWGAVADSPSATVAGLGDGVTAAVYPGQYGLRVVVSGGAMDPGRPVQVAVEGLRNPAQGSYSLTLRWLAPDSRELASTQVSLAVAGAGALRFLEEPPAALALGQPFSVQVAVYAPDGQSLRSDLSDRILLGTSCGVLKGETTVRATGGVATFSSLRLADSPIGPGCRLIAQDLDTAAVTAATSRPFSLARLLFTSDPAKLAYAAWDRAVPEVSGGTGQGSAETEGLSFAVVSLSGSAASSVPAAVYLAGDPAGTVPPALDDSLRFRWWDAQARIYRVEDHAAPAAPVPVLRLEEGVWVYLRNAQGLSFGAGDVYAVAPQGPAFLRTWPAYLPPTENIAAGTVSLTPQGTVRAGEEGRVEVAVATAARTRALTLRLTYPPGGATHLGIEPAPGVTVQAQPGTLPGQLEVTVRAAAGAVPDGVLFIWRLKPRQEGALGLTSSLAVPGLASAWQTHSLPVAPRTTAWVSGVEIAFGPDEARLELQGSVLGGVDRVVLEPLAGGAPVESASVEAVEGGVRARFGALPPARYRLRLFAGGQERVVDSESPAVPGGILAAPPRAALTGVSSAFEGGFSPVFAGHSDLYVRNYSPVDAVAVVGVVKAGPWVQITQAGRYVWNVGPSQGEYGVEVLGEDHGVLFLAVRVPRKVPAGPGAVYLWIHRKIDPEAWQQGITVYTPEGRSKQLADRDLVQPLIPVTLANLPADRWAAIRQQHAGDLTALLDEALRESMSMWSAAVEALDSMPGGESASYLEALSATYPDLADALFALGMEDLATRLEGDWDRAQFGGSRATREGILLAQAGTGDGPSLFVAQGGGGTPPGPGVVAITHPYAVWAQELASGPSALDPETWTHPEPNPELDTVVNFVGGVVAGATPLGLVVTPSDNDALRAGVVVGTAVSLVTVAPGLTKACLKAGAQGVGALARILSSPRALIDQTGKTLNRWWRIANSPIEPATTPPELRFLEPTVAKYVPKTGLSPQGFTAIADDFYNNIGNQVLDRNLVSVPGQGTGRPINPSDADRWRNVSQLVQEKIGPNWWQMDAAQLNQALKPYAKEFGQALWKDMGNEVRYFGWDIKVPATVAKDGTTLGAEALNVGHAAYGPFGQHVAVFSYGNFRAWYHLYPDRAVYFQNGQLVTKSFEQIARDLLVSAPNPEYLFWGAWSLGTAAGQTATIDRMSSACSAANCTPVGVAFDPNDITAFPAGIGDGRFIRADEALTYLVRFENEGSAPARDIRIEVPLDPGLDPDTLQVTRLSHPSYRVDPDALETGEPREDGDEYTEVARWRVDPEQGLLIVELPGIMLPPENPDDPGANEGFVEFVVRPRSGVAHDQTIRAQAQIYFDYNPPVATNVEERTVDRQGPSVTLAELPAETSGSVEVRVDGSDGAGVPLEIQIWVARDGGAPELWRTLAPGGSATFAGEAGHRYAFFARGVDALGNQGPDTPAREVRFAAAAGARAGAGPAPSAPPAGPRRAQAALQPGAAAAVELPGLARLELPAGAVVGTGATVALAEVPREQVPAPPHPLLGPAVEVTLQGGQLAAPVRLVLRYDPAAVQVGALPTVFTYDPEAGRWRQLGGRVDPGRGEVSVTLPHLSLFALLTVRLPDFPDLAAHWARGPARALSARGVVQGYPDGRFGPERTVTRAEAAAMLVRALGLHPAGAAEQTFLARDFADGALVSEWARPWLAAAIRAGLVQGEPGAHGRPVLAADRPVTRAELVVLLARAVRRTGEEPRAGSALAFADAMQVPQWAQADLAHLTGSGLVRGYPDGTFRPAGEVIRGEAAALLARWLVGQGVE